MSAGSKLGPLDNLRVEQLGNRLAEYQAEFLRGKSGLATLGWCLVVWALGDAICVASSSGSVTIVAFRAALEGMRAPERILSQRSIAGLAIVLFELVLLLIGSACLRRSPWSAWLRRALRQNSPLALLRAASSAGVRQDLRKFRFGGFAQRHRLSLRSALMFSVQVAVWFYAWGFLEGLYVSLPTPVVAPVAVRILLACLALFISWVGTTIMTSIARDRSAIVGIATGLGLVFGGLIYGASGADGMFGSIAGSPLEHVRWWCVGIVALSMAVVLSLSADNWETSKRRVLECGGPGRELHQVLPDFRRSLAPPLGFVIDGGGDSVVVLEHHDSDDYSVCGPRAVIFPIDRLYEILNLSGLHRMPEMTFAVETPQKEARLTINMLVRNSPPEESYERGELEGLVLAGLAVRRFVHVVFKRGEGELTAMALGMSEVLRSWMGRSPTTVARLMSRCDEIKFSVETGRALPGLPDEVISAVDTRLQAGIETARGSLSLRMVDALGRWESASSAQRALMEVELQLLAHEETLRSAQQALNDRCEEALRSALVRDYSDRQKARYEQSFIVLSRMVQFEVVKVDVAFLPLMEELKQKIDAVKKSIMTAGRFDPGVADEWKQLEKEWIELVKNAMKEKTPIDRIIPKDVRRILLGRTSDPPEVARGLEDRQHESPV